MAEKNDALSALVSLIRGEMLDVNTCIEGVIVSYVGGVASVDADDAVALAASAQHPRLHVVDDADALLARQTLAGGVQFVDGPVGLDPR